MTLNEIVLQFMKAQSIAILPHVSADGDALGSSIALGLSLRKLGKEVMIYTEEEVPYIYSYLIREGLVEVFSGQTKSCDLAAALDTGDLDRLGRRRAIFEAARVTVNIDHHQTNTEFASFNYVHTASSAVGEIIYQIIKTMGQTPDVHISESLYVAIATDTGGFRFSNTTSATHRITGELIDNGINVAEISQKIFDNTSLSKVKLMGFAISSLEILENGKVAFLTITDKMMNDAGARDEDCDGIVNIGRNIRGVEVAVLVRQKGNGTLKINLRSRNYVDVAAIAGAYTGGGHKRASGCTVEGELVKIKAMLIKDIREAL